VSLWFAIRVNQRSAAVKTPVTGIRVHSCPLRTLAVIPHSALRIPHSHHLCSVIPPCPSQLSTLTINFPLLPPVLSFFFSANPFDIPYAAAYSPRVNHAAVRWWLTGKNMAGRGRCSRDLRAGLAGRVVWLLPRPFLVLSRREGEFTQARDITRGLFFEISIRLLSCTDSQVPFYPCNSCNSCLPWLSAIFLP